MPNVNELRSLVDYGLYNPATSAAPDFLDPLFEGDTWYWTSTTEPDTPDRAYMVDFETGVILGTVVKSGTAAVICVRDP